MGTSGRRTPPAPVSAGPRKGARTAYRGTQKTSKSLFGFMQETENFCPMVTESRRRYMTVGVKSGEDLFGKEASETISKEVLDTILIGEDRGCQSCTAPSKDSHELDFGTRRFLQDQGLGKDRAHL
jgi:hypothetical protein